jgi:hypothetical protein
MSTSTNWTIKTGEGDHLITSKHNGTNGEVSFSPKCKSKSNGSPQKSTFWHTNVSPWVSFQKCLQWMQQTSVHRRATNFYRFSIGDRKRDNFRTRPPPAYADLGTLYRGAVVQPSVVQLHKMSRTSISVPLYSLLGRESCRSMDQL